MANLTYTPIIRDLTPEELEWVHGGQSYAQSSITEAGGGSGGSITETGEGTGTP